MNHDAPAGGLLGTSLGRGARDECHSVQQGVEVIVGSADGPFRKDDQRPFGLFEDLDGRVDRRPIDAFPIDAERAHPADGKAGKPVLIEQMPARQRIQMTSDFARHPAQHQRITVATVVGCQQDAMTGLQRRAEAIEMADFVAGHSLLAAQIAVDKVQPLDHRRPPIATMRGDELVTLVNDDVLHGGDPQLRTNRQPLRGSHSPCRRYLPPIIPPTLRRRLPRPKNLIGH